MSSTRNASETSSSNFEALLNEALTKYTQKTGEDLRDHPLASKIDSCKSADSFLAIFQEQVQEFKGSRNDSKLIDRLGPVVDFLFVLSKSGVVKDAADLVSAHQVAVVMSAFPTSFSYRCSPLQNMSCLRSASFSQCVSPSHSSYLF